MSSFLGTLSNMNFVHACVCEFTNIFTYSHCIVPNAHEAGMVLMTIAMMIGSSIKIVPKPPFPP